MIVMKDIFISNNAEETISFAEQIAKQLKNGDVIAFYGGLGVGKTTFMSGLAQGLSMGDVVFSPTYTLLNHYQTSNPNNIITNLYHFDMYRICGYDDLHSTGFFDYLGGNGILAIEWSLNIEQFLPENTIKITLEIIDENARKIIIETKSSKGMKIKNE